MPLRGEQTPSPATHARWYQVAALVILGVAILVYARLDGKWIDTVQTRAPDIAAPALGVAHRLADGLDFVWVTLESYVDRQGELQRLRAELQELRELQTTVHDLERENAQLRAFNRVRLPPRSRFVTVQVIGGSHGPFLESVLVNAGATNNIQDGAPVIDGNGLVGRVIGLGQRTSRVLLLNDINSRVPVIAKPSGVHAILTGDGGPRPVLTLFSDSTPVHVGESIYTSGRGGVYPVDILVGRVTAGSDDGVRVTLAARYDDLTFVRILEPTVPPFISNPSVIAPPAETSQATPPLPKPPVTVEHAQSANPGDGAPDAD